MKILIADDHAILRQGLVALLQDDSIECTVVGEAENGLQVIEFVEKLRPDIVIMDISMPELDGLKATERLKKKYPKLKIIILSMYSEASYIRQAFSFGASGYLLKETAFDELKMALGIIRKGNIYLSSALLPLVLDGFADSMPDEDIIEKYHTLTKREKEVLHLIINGVKRSAIAEQLFISLKTVDHHKKNIKEKLDMRNDLDMNEYASLVNADFS